MNHGQALSRIFTPNFARKIIADKADIYIRELTTIFGVLKKPLINGDYKQLYKKAFDIMKEDYRNEYVYKTFYYKNFLELKEKKQKTFVTSELRIGSSIADLVSLEKDGITIEIKSDIDKIEKSIKQINNYQKMFPYTSLISNKDKIIKVKEKVPNQTGLYILHKDLNIECVREAIYFDEKIDYKTMFYTLRRTEYENIINNYYNELPNVPSGDIFEACFKKGEKIPKDLFINLFNTEIKNRIVKLDNPSFGVPDYLIFLAKKSSLNKKEKELFIKKINN